MTAPGWYNAEGDPPGSQRYWDGAQWVGEPVFEPSAVGAPPAPGQSPAEGGFAYVSADTNAPSAFPSGLKVTAIILSVLKAIPLVFALIGGIWLAVASNELDNEFGDSGLFDDLIGAALVFLFAFIIIGGALIGTQFAGALKERPILLFVPALIMAIIDVLITIGSWASYSESQNNAFSSNDSPLGAIVMTLTMIAQIAVAVWAIRSNK